MEEMFIKVLINEGCTHILNPRVHSAISDFKARTGAITPDLEFHVSPLTLSLLIEKNFIETKLFVNKPPVYTLFGTTVVINRTVPDLGMIIHDRKDFTFRSARASGNLLDNPYFISIKKNHDYTLHFEANELTAIKDVIFNDPATIVIWKDGSKTVVKANNEPFDPEKGLAMAITKKVFGNEGNYNDILKKWLPK